MPEDKIIFLLGISAVGGSKEHERKIILCFGELARILLAVFWQGRRRWACLGGMLLCWCETFVGDALYLARSQALAIFFKPLLLFLSNHDVSSSAGLASLVCLIFGLSLCLCL